MVIMLGVLRQPNAMLKARDDIDQFEFQVKLKKDL